MEVRHVELGGRIAGGDLDGDIGAFGGVTPRQGQIVDDHPRIIAFKHSFPPQPEAIEELRIFGRESELMARLEAVLDFSFLRDEAFDAMLLEMDGLVELDLFGRPVTPLHAQDVILGRFQLCLFEDFGAGQFRFFRDALRLVDAEAIAPRVRNRSIGRDEFFDIDLFDNLLDDLIANPCRDDRFLDAGGNDFIRLGLRTLFSVSIPNSSVAAIIDCPLAQSIIPLKDEILLNQYD